MRRSIWILGLVLACSLGWAAEGIPVGTYEGTGVWRAMDGSSGDYKSRMSFEEGQITIEAEFDHEGTARTERHTVKLVSKGAGFFDLLDDKGESIGQLACLDGQCSYGVRQDGLVVTESWRLVGNELQKFGSKKIGAFQVVWTEALYAN